MDFDLCKIFVWWYRCLDVKCLNPESWCIHQYGGDQARNIIFFRLTWNMLKKLLRKKKFSRTIAFFLHSNAIQLRDKTDKEQSPIYTPWKEENVKILYLSISFWRRHLDRVLLYYFLKEGVFLDVLLGKGIFRIRKRHWYIFHRSTQDFLMSRWNLLLLLYS